MTERILTYLQAVNETLDALLAEDDRVFIIGEDIGRYGGSFQQTAGLQERYGGDRVIDAPISEAGFTGLAVGAAATGLRPIVDMVFADFMLLAADQVINQAAKLHYMTGGALEVPLVIRAAQGAGRSSAAQHSQTLHVLFAHIPGLKVVLPSTPADAKGLLVSAIRDPNPVLIFEDKMEYGRRGPVPEGLFETPLGVAATRRDGTDVTVVATSSMVHVAMDAAAELEREGISVGVIDPRTVKPLDVDRISSAVARTGHAVVVDEGPRAYGAGAEIAASIYEHAFDYLEAPIVRLGALDVPVPFSPELEKATIPDVRTVANAIRGMRA